MALVLVVDDDNDVADVLGMILIGEGHQVAYAKSANEALSQAARHQFDAVIMDMSLLRSRGVTAALALRGLGYDGPIIGITGGLVPDDERLIDRAKFAAMLNKPVMPAVFAATVAEHLNKAG